MKLILFFLLSISTLPAGEMRDILNKFDINGFERPGGTDKDTEHSYLEVYEKLLEPYRNGPCSLLEIGVNSGGSVLLWHEYLPHAQLSFIDIRDCIDSKIQSLLDPNRCSFALMDAYNSQAIDALKNAYPEGFDIIIDDGDHLLSSQFFVLEQYISLLKEGGILIIEDIQTRSDLQKLLKFSSPGISVKCIDRRKKKNRYDDVLIVARKNIHK